MLVTLLMTPAQLSGHGATLLDHGWTASMPARRGFVTAAGEQPTMVCRGEDFVTLSFQPRERGGSYVRATLTRDPRRTCASRPEFSLGDVTIPALEPPPNVRMQGYSSGGNLDSFTSSTRLLAALDPRDVAEHYVRQLVDAGWRLEGRVRDADGVAIARLSSQARTGQPVTAILAITTLRTDQGASLDASLRVVRD